MGLTRGQPLCVSPQEKESLSAVIAIPETQGVRNDVYCYDVKAFAKAGYNGVVKIEASVDEHFKQSYKENAKSIKTSMSGGSGDGFLTHLDKWSSRFAWLMHCD